MKLGGHAGLADAFLAAAIGVMGVLASVCAVQAALRLRGEESAQRAELVLATAVGRLRWALSHLAVALLGPVVLLVVTGVVTGLSYGVRTGDVGVALPRVLAAALAQIPAAWVMAGLAVALFGLAPRLTSLAWAALVAFLLIAEVGSLLGLSRWAMDICPFTHVPKLPGATFTATPLVWLTAVALALAGAGLVALRRRDVG